ncbi:MAG: hypothetical protein AAB554_02840 [Patescibacteria group bacterium]
MVEIPDVIPPCQKSCVCCGKESASNRRQPLCDVCVAPGEVRSYCAKCGARNAYHTDDFVRVMSAHYPEISFAPGMAVWLPACARCYGDGRPSVPPGNVRFYGISFD